MTGALVAERLTFAYSARDGRRVLSDFSCAFESGKVSVLVGPNGCGKSTLLKLLAGVLKPAAGRVTLGGADMAALPSRERARQVGLLFQESVAPADLSVRELVLEGRYPHLGVFAQPGAADREKADAAIGTCGLADLAACPVGALSSGQRRLAFIAMAVAQDPRWLLLDEPTTYLDIAHELDILSLVRRLNRAFGISVVLAIHDLNAAAAVADGIVAMKDGALVASGSPAEVLTPPTLRTVFGAEATVIPDPNSGQPRIFWNER